MVVRRSASSGGDRRPPSLRLLLAENAEATRVLASAGITIVVMVLLTGILCSFGSWGSWLEKASPSSTATWA